MFFIVEKHNLFFAYGNGELKFLLSVKPVCFYHIGHGLMEEEYILILLQIFLTFEITSLKRIS